MRKNDRTLLNEFLAKKNIVCVKNPSKTMCKYYIENFDDVENIISATKEVLDWNGSSIYFRGQSYDRWKITASVSRVKGLMQYEKDMLFEFAKLENSKINLETLIKAQHYGLPTRLIDVTPDWKIALWFACQSFTKNNGEEHDGELVLFNSVVEDENIIDYALWQIENYNLVKNETSENNIRKFECEAGVKNKKENIDVNRYFIPCVIDFSEYIDDVRVKNQKGCGILSIINTNEYKRGLYSHFSQVHKKYMVSIIIPGKLKSFFLEKLDKEGINQEFIYTNNLEHECEYVKAKYIKMLKQNEEARYRN